MATRSKAKASAANGKHVPPHPSAKTGKTETDPIKALNEERGINGQSKVPSKRATKSKKMAVVIEELCTCSQGDDGTPMVHCDECHIWYHFSCVNLTENDANDMSTYICSGCTTKSGRRTIMNWEGPCAFEEEGRKSLAHSNVKPQPPKPQRKVGVKRAIPDDSSDEDNSDDDFTAASKDDDQKPATAKPKRRRTAVDSGSDTELSDDSKSLQPRKRRLKKASRSPAPNRGADSRRRASTSDARTPLKRNKSSSQTAEEDPTRKYCLGKLEELFCEIFFRYPHVESPETSKVVSKPVDKMTDEEKDSLTQEAKAFALAIEQAIFDIHADHDKKGNPTAGINYKDRFRTLQFNLSQPDRVVIHQRITSRNISPKDLSLMSSTDLANEETKQIIKIAEQEALEHSILPKTIQPRAKMTHKGIEDIEIDAGTTAMSASDFEALREREADAEERRERERMARLRGIQRQRTGSMSVGPESPAVAHPPDSWGAPPPVPSHAAGTGDRQYSPARPSQTGPDVASIVADGEEHPEMNLSDLINLDEESTPAPDAVSPPPTSAHPADSSMQVDPFSQPVLAEVSSSSTIDSFSGIPPSPLAEKPTFNFSTLWSAASADSKQEDAAMDDGGEEPMVLSPSSLSPPSFPEDEHDDVLSQDVSPSENAEPDFDMLFEDNSSPVVESKVEEKAPVSIESMPQVWVGKISMPLDSTIPEETPMTARQIAGTTIDQASPLWKTLFPSDHLRIDGRVQTTSSANYLTQMRLNSMKELYAVIFTPASEEDESSFRTLSDFLVTKERHGLVFPWGSRPKDYHPGKELYIIPLKADEPIPEYMELLDNLILPKERSRNYFVGIWILNKGKLAPPAIIPGNGTVAPSPFPSNSPVPHLPTPPIALTPTRFPVRSPPHIPSGSGTPTQIPPPVPPVSSILPPVTQLPPGIDPVALAAEMASLTPEQKALIRSLQMSHNVPAVTPAAVPPPAPFVPGPYAHTHVPPHPMQQTPQDYGRQSWAPPAGTSYGAPPPQHFPPHGDPWANGAPHPHLPPHAERYDYVPGHNGHDHRGGSRGRGRGRGRGQGGWDRNQPPRGGGGAGGPARPADSGWPRRQTHSNNHNQGGSRW